MTQDQRSLTEQLQSLILIASKNGLYDATDWLKYKLEMCKYITLKYNRGICFDLYDFSQGGGVLQEIAQAMENSARISRSKIEQCLKFVNEHLELPNGTKLPGPNTQINNHEKLKEIKEYLEEALT